MGKRYVSGEQLYSIAVPNNSLASLYPLVVLIAIGSSHE